MKISICIPQYNRILFLLRNLELIAKQQYPHLEIVISDDCSTDDTEERIKELLPVYKYPIIYYRNAANQGYDRNYRQSIELATGQYALVIGNDDSINPALDIKSLVIFLQENNFPDIGYCNFIEENENNKFVERAKKTAVIGTGSAVAMRHYSCFSFVGGLIYKKSTFTQFNSSKHDGSIYAQMYMGSLIVASGFRLFSIYEPLVIKDLSITEARRDSYRDKLAKNWKDYKMQSGGLPSVMNVLIDAFRDAGVLQQPLIYSIFKRIYTVTFPFWVIDYKSNGALPAAVGLVQGLNPKRNSNFRLLNSANKLKIWTYYSVCSITALLMPVFVFNKLKYQLYKRLKKA